MFLNNGCVSHTCYIVVCVQGNHLHHMHISHICTNHPQEFETNGSHNLDKNRTSGSLKAKLKFPDHGEHLIELSQIDISSLYAYTFILECVTTV